MQTIRATEARANFAALLRRAADGKERIVIERRGKARAVVVPLEDLAAIEGRDERAFGECEARLRAIMNHAPIEIHLKDAEGRYAEINRRYEELWGVTNEEVKGKLPIDVHREEHAKVLREHDLAVLESGRVMVHEDVAVRDDGEHYLQMIKFPLRNTDGDIVGLGGIVIDVTGRKRAEAALKSSEQRYRQIFDVADVCLWDEDFSDVYAKMQHLRRDGVKDLRAYFEDNPNAVSDLAGKIKVNRVNDATVRLFGANSQEELLGSLDRILPLTATDVFLEEFIAVWEGKASYRAEVRQRNFAGEDLWVIVTMPIPVAPEDFRSIPISVHDITDRKRAEVALRKAHGELEQRVAERTAELQKINEALRNEVTRRKRTEAALRGSEERYRNLFDSTPISIREEDFSKVKARIDALDIPRGEGLEPYLDRNPAVVEECGELIGMVDANQACLELHNFGDKANLLANLTGSFSNQALDTLKTVLAAVHNGETSLEFETFVLRADGHKREVAARWSVASGHENTYSRVLFTSVDITERKQAEQELRESEELFSKAFHASPGLFAISKPEDGSHYDVNETWIKVLGYTRDEAMAHSALDLGIWADPSDRARFVDRLRKERSVRGFEAKFRTKSGDEVDFLVSGEYIEVGGEPRLLVVSHDITELKKSEQELRESEERFRSIIENSPATITLKDLDGRFRLVNSRFVDRHRISAADVIGKNSHDVYPREFADAMESLDKEVIANNAVCERELTLTFGDGSLRTVVVNKFPVPDADGKTVGVGTISTDVTEHRRAEEQLRQAHRMEAVGQLTGGVAHDFNNLLAVIMGNAELLGERLGADEESVAAIVRAALRGADLTQRLLAFSRRQPLRPRATDLGELVHGMGELLRRALGETIEVKIAPVSDPGRVHIDPGQLENAILNLAINARDAMPKGGHLNIVCAQATQGDDYLSTRPEADPNDYVVLEISDTGTGMEPDVLARAVEPFFTTKDVGKGTGLGLSMVYGFAKQSGGELAILSDEGRGTTVKLYLPRSREDVGPGDFSAAPDAERGHGETVLVVEDDADVRVLARFTLENLGYRVVTAEDAQAGLAALETAPRIDLLFSDVVLPGGTSGPDMAREAKRRFPELKVLFTSGYAESAVHTGTSLPRNADLLTKPFHKRELAQRVRAALDR